MSKPPFPYLKDSPHCQSEFTFAPSAVIQAWQKANKSLASLDRKHRRQLQQVHTALQTSFFLLVFVLFFPFFLVCVCVCVSKPSLAAAGHRSLVGSVRPCRLRLSSWREALLFAIPVTDTVPALLPVERDLFPLFFKEKNIFGRCTIGPHIK